MKEVSIITPCYNASKTIFNTLNSIKNQSFENFEVIIIDDFSQDDSTDIIKLFSMKDERFVLFERKKNYGVVAARNFGIEKAVGRYITFLDSDDIWKNQFLYLSLQIHKKINPGITHSPYFRFYSINQKYFGQRYFPPDIVDYKNILKRNYMGLSTVMVDTHKTGKFNFQDLRPEDYSLWLSLIKNNKVYSKSIGSLQAYIRISDGQRSSNKFKAFLRLKKFYFGQNEISLFMKIIYLFSWVIENFKHRLGRRFVLKKEHHKDIF